MTRHFILIVSRWNFDRKHFKRLFLTLHHFYAENTICLFRQYLSIPPSGRHYATFKKQTPSKHLC